MVDIKDISGNIRFSTPVNEGSKRKFLLMKEDYITLKFSLASPVYFQLGDGIDNEIGIFELVDLYKPVYNTTTGAYDYELRLDAYYWKWKNKKFFYTPETTGREAGWNLTATLDTHLNVLLANLKALGYKFREEEFTYKIDSTVANTSKLVSYDNVNLIDALTQMAETWECEWWITENIIHFGRCEYSSPVDFKAGDLTDTENVNVNSMTRSDSQTTYATRVYAFGSTRNIPASYRKSLIFDVKEVSDRDISDTARALSNKYFPASSQIKGADIDISIKHTDTYHPEYPRKYTVDVADSLKAGNYLFKANGASINVYYQTTPHANSDLKAVFTLEYNSLDKSEEIELGELVVKDVDNWPVLKLEDMAFALKENIQNCRLSIKLEYSNNAGIYVEYNGSLSLHCENIGADTSVTFLSGTNAGQTFDAVYNPDLLTGDSANVIRLPEGVTASLGDMYTIGNIIKGKVPDNYFSKDDKELTLNGVVQKRLMLPEGIPYVDAYRYGPTGERIDIGDERYDDPDNVEMPEEEAIEEIVIFEDEYPKYTGSISGAGYDEKDEEDEDGNKTGNKYRIYTFKDTGLKNFTEDFRLDELRLIFQTGKLAGLDFALNLKESDDTGTTFEIVRNEDYGRYLPDDTLYPQASDTYILYGFDPAFISEQMSPDAERDLLKKTKEHVRKTMIDPSTYDCEMDADFIYDNGNIRTYEVGAKVNLINKAYFPEGRQSRIIGFEWALDIPYDHPVYTVGETATYSRIGEIESKLDSLTYKGQTYSGSVVGGGGTGVYVIGVNDRTLPSDRNTFSAKRIINEISGRALSRLNDDTASGRIAFRKGLVSDELVEANNGLVVRKEAVMEPQIALLSGEFGDNITEENTDALVEELSTEVTGAATLGGLDNVAGEADGISDTDVLLVRPAGASEWAVDTTLPAQVSRLMSKVFPFTMSLSGGGTYEKGSSQTVNLSWTYDRDIESQSINNESLPVGSRSRQYTGVTTDTVYTLKAVQGEQAYAKSVSAQFKLRKYYGVSANSSLDNDGILSLSSAWAVRAQASTVFDCTGGKYPYYILPTSMASGIQFWIGGLRNTDWTEEVREITNAYGYKESYTIYRLNNIQTGVLNIEVR